MPSETSARIIVPVRRCSWSCYFLESKKRKAGQVPTDEAMSWAKRQNAGAARGSVKGKSLSMGKGKGDNDRSPVRKPRSKKVLAGLWGSSARVGHTRRSNARGEE